MKRVLLALVFLWGCRTIRNDTTYRAETDFTDLMVRGESESVRKFLQTQCTCVEGQWVGQPQEACAHAADWWSVYTSRWAWHMAMVRYNGSVSDTDPGPPPQRSPVTCGMLQP